MHNRSLGKVSSKPSKSYSIHWIYRKSTSIKIMLEDYGAHITHVESLSQTDFQTLESMN